MNACSENFFYINSKFSFATHPNGVCLSPLGSLSCFLKLLESVTAEAFVLFFFKRKTLVLNTNPLRSFQSADQVFSQWPISVVPNQLMNYIGPNIYCLSYTFFLQKKTRKILFVFFQILSIRFQPMRPATLSTSFLILWTTTMRSVRYFFLI